MNLPSVKHISRHLLVSNEIANKIRTSMEEYRDNKIRLYTAMEQINNLFAISSQNSPLLSHGVEIFNTYRKNGKLISSYLYVNFGDTYDTTVIAKKNSEGNPFIITSWGDIVEKEEVK